jgi:hypothetical protein
VLHYGEPPCADPHAGWCGGRGGKPPGYPIMQDFSHQRFCQRFSKAKKAKAPIPIKNENITKNLGIIIAALYFFVSEKNVFLVSTSDHTHACKRKPIIEARIHTINAIHEVARSHKEAGSSGMNELLKVIERASVPVDREKMRLSISANNSFTRD